VNLYPRVFLAAPIFPQNETWREDIAIKLALHGIELTEDRGQDVRMRLYDLTLCGGVLVDGREGPCWDAAIEMTYGYMLNKPIVVIHPKVSEVSPWLTYHSKAIVSSVGKAADAMKALLDTPSQGARK
jgi:hypothetical protein